MLKNQKIKVVLITELLGFVIVVLFLWVNEVWDIPHLYFGSPPTPIIWAESIFETVLVVLLGLYVMFVSWFFLVGIGAPERGPQLCTVCKKQKMADKWVLSQQNSNISLDEKRPQCLCPECFNKIIHYLTVNGG